MTKKRKSKSARHKPESTKPINRRKFLGLSRNSAVAVLAVGGAGFFVVRHVQGAMHEHDLSRVGNGRPTVVQIHDPQCSQCLALQRQTRRALDSFDSDEIDYVIANIRSAEGRAFASRYAAAHVTLLLFDSDGEHKGTLRGQRRSSELANAFRQIVPD